MPILMAILSAVLNPIPEISSHKIYGFADTICFAFGPNFLYIFIHWLFVTPCLWKYNMTSLSPCCSIYDSYIIWNFFSPMPSISINLSIWFSIISKVSSPNLSIIFLAVTGPIPWITPALKYFSIPSNEFGSTSSYSCMLNWFPNCLCTVQYPLSFTFWPSFINGTVPTALIKFFSLLILQTTYPVSSLLNTILSTNPFRTSIESLQILLLTYIIIFILTFNLKFIFCINIFYYIIKDYLLNCLLIFISI